jgi:molecular chaperone GrpE
MGKINQKDGKMPRTKVKNEQAEEVSKLKSQLNRAFADYDNFRKRVELERGAWEKIAASKIVLGFLPVFDMLLDAQKHLKDAGLEIVIGEFRKSMYEVGVEEILIDEGDAFDPTKHEATEMVAGGNENTIAEVVQTGWKIKESGHIIRPSKVKVYKMSN